MGEKRPSIIERLYRGGRKAEVRYKHFPGSMVRTLVFPKLPAPKYLGDGRLMVEDETFLLDANQEDMIEVLLDGHGAASKQELATVSEQVSRVLNKLRSLHPAVADHVSLPGARGKGGYRTTIVDARPPKAPETKRHL